jgi:hypothetical protein
MAFSEIGDGLRVSIRKHAVRSTCFDSKHRSGVRRRVRSSDRLFYVNFRRGLVVIAVIGPVVSGEGFPDTSLPMRRRERRPACDSNVQVAVIVAVGQGSPLHLAVT